MPNLADYYIPVISLPTADYINNKNYLNKEANRLISKGCKVVLFEAPDIRNEKTMHIFLNHTCDEAMVAHCDRNATTPEKTFKAMRDIVAQKECKVLWYKE